MRPGSLPVVLVLLVLLAGCIVPAAHPKPLKLPPLPRAPHAALPSPAVNLTFEASGAFPAGAVVFRWSTDALGVLRSELLYGTDSVADLRHPSYAHRVNGTSADNVTFTTVVPMPPTGRFFARVHVVAAGTQAWSDEVLVLVPSDGPVPMLADVPAQVEAGVPFALGVRAAGNATGQDLAVAASDVSSARLPWDSPPAAWRGANVTLVHAGPFTPPFAANATLVLPWPGLWHVRAHALAAAQQDVWSDEVQLLALPPRAPNVVVLGTDGPEAHAGTPWRVTFALNLPNGSASSVGVHFSPRSSSGEPPGFAPHYWPDERDVTLDGTRAAGRVALDVAFPEPGTWFLRAHAYAQGRHVWGPELSVHVGNPAAPPQGPFPARTEGRTRFLLAWDTLDVATQGASSPVLAAALGDACVQAVFGYHPPVLGLTLPPGEDAPPVVLVRVFDGSWLASPLLNLTGPPLRVDRIAQDLFPVESAFLDGPRQVLLNLTGGNVTANGTALHPGESLRFHGAYPLKQDGVWFDVREELRLVDLGFVDPQVQPHLC